MRCRRNMTRKENTTIDTEHGDGPSITQNLGGASYSVVINGDDEYNPIEVYKNGELKWRGDAQDLHSDARVSNPDSPWVVG